MTVRIRLPARPGPSADVVATPRVERSWCYQRASRNPPGVARLAGPRAAVFLSSLLCLAVWWACGSNPSHPDPTSAFLPDTLSFPVTAVGDTALLSTRLVSLTGKDQTIRLLVESPEFAVLGPDTGAAFELAAQETVEVQVRFHPASVGAKATQVLVEGARCDPLVCVAAAEWDPCLVDPMRLEFGEVELGEEKMLPFTIHCTGPDSASGVVDSPCGEYTVSAGWGGFSLAPGDSLRVEVSFRPQARGESQCIITLGDYWCEPVECAGISSRTWLVLADRTGDAATVQAAIDSSTHGDIVQVGPGTYLENIDFHGKNITVKSALGSEVTILDGSSRAASVVVFRNSETRDAVLEGFTVTGGQGTLKNVSRNGGGIYCANGSPTIRGNLIIRNAAMEGSGAGGGMMVGTGFADGRFAYPLILGNTFAGNGANMNGGGIGVVYASADIEGNTFRGNTARYDGGGVWAWLLFGEAQIIGNQFWGNIAGDHGGGIDAANAGQAGPFVISRNLLVRNEAHGSDAIEERGTGGGIAARGITGTVSRNTLVGNVGTGRSAHTGGGILISDIAAGMLAVDQNLFVGNEGCGLACYLTAPTAVTAYSNLFWSNVPSDLGPTVSSCLPQLSSESLFADPIFCGSSAGDYSVSSESPALVGAAPIGAFERPGCVRGSMQHGGETP